MSYFENTEVAVVTGAGSGIGRACALIFAREAARVVVSDIDEKAGKETVQLIEALGGKAVFKVANVANSVEVETLMQFTVDTYGRLDSLVNNAGIGGVSASTADYPLDAWDKVVAINQSAVFYGMKYAIPHMLENNGGAIVNMASILGTVGFANSIAYVSAKHAVVGMTKVVALEYSAKGIRVNVLGPAFINTPLLKALDDMGEGVRQMITNMHPLGRMGEPDEVGELAVWLCSKRASFCTGAYYPVDGAYLAQ